MDRVSFVLAAVCAGLVGCSGPDDDGSDTDLPAGDPPFVQIWSHEEGTVVLEGIPTTLGGTASDDAGPEGIVATWFVDDVEQCSGPLDADENTTCLWTVPVGMLTARVRLEATNASGATGSAEIGLSGFDNKPPKIKIDEPVTPPWHSNVPVLFSGGVRDQGTTPGEMLVLWSSDVDGPLEEVDGTVDSYYRFDGEALLSQGTHVLTASMTDPSGTTTTEQVTITVGPPTP